MGQGQIRSVNSPLTSREVRRFKKEMKSFIEGLAEQPNPFLRPNLYSWGGNVNQEYVIHWRRMLRRGMIWHTVMQERERTNPPAREKF